MPSLSLSLLFKPIASCLGIHSPPKRPSQHLIARALPALHDLLIIHPVPRFQEVSNLLRRHAPRLLHKLGETTPLVDASWPRILADIGSRCRGFAVLRLKLPALWGAIELSVGVVRDLLVDEGDVVVGEGVRVGGGRAGQFGFVLSSCEGVVE
jgi:hypothetical protein